MTTTETTNQLSELEKTTRTLPVTTGDDAAQRVEMQLEDLDKLFAQIDAGEFDVNSQEYPWPDGMKLSIVIPVYNERSTILEVLSRVKQIPVPKELIIVDDCSTDGTRGWLETVRDTPELRLIYKAQNEGKGAALRTGFEAATGDIVIIQDADLEYDPRDILRVVRPIVVGETDVAFGSRYLSGESEDASRLHRFGNRCLTAFSNLMNGVQLTDMETCYKAFRRSVLQKIELKQNRFGFEPEVTAKLARRRYRIQEVPISYRPRGYSEGKKIGLKDMFSTLWCIVRYGCSD